MRNCARLKLGLLSATFFTSAMLAAPAFAEDAPAADAPDAAPADATSSSGDAAGDSIIVTATRRATTLMDTPINITALGAEQLDKERIDDVRDLAAFTPGMTVSNSGPGSSQSIVLRGLNASANGGSSLAIYLGEVPLNYDFKLLDIDRVETLLGPQGTLYGLGTLAGAIRYIPNRPKTDVVEGAAHGRTFVKDHSGDIGYQVDGVINIPIMTDHIAFRSATGYYFDPGYIDYPLLVQDPGVSWPQQGGPDYYQRVWDNPEHTSSHMVHVDIPDWPGDGSVASYDDYYNANLRKEKDLNFEKTFTTRNQLLFQFNENVSVNFTYAYQQTKTDGGSSNSAGVLGTNQYESASRFEEPVNRHAHLGAMEINANIADIVDLVSTTAITRTKTRSKSDNTDLLIDLDYGYEHFPAFVSWNESVSTGKQFNQEVRLVSRHGGPFNWTIGGFYNEEKNQRDYAEHVPNHPWVDTATNPDALEYVSYTTSKVTEKAIFGEGTFHITPEWQVTAGARYFKYTSDIAGAQTLPLLGQPLSPYDKTARGGHAGKDGWVWKFNTSYNFTPDFMVYATYSKGYRIGGPNTVAPCDDPLPPGQNICALPNELQYGPDTTKNLELGFRAQMFDRKFTINADVYTIKWDGIQVRSATLNGATGITINGSTARSKGFETSFQLRPIPELSIRGTYSYNDAYLTDTIPGASTIREIPGDYSTGFIQIDGLSGDRLPASAKNSGSLGATYTVPMPAGDLSFNWTATYRGNVVSRLGWDRAYGELLPSYVVHRASITYDADRYSISLFANNIFDNDSAVRVGGDLSRVGVNDGIVSRYYTRTIMQPRVVGVEGRVKF